MLRRKVAIFLFVAVMLSASALCAQAGGAMLFANGHVEVNGQTAAYSTSVFAGDKIDVSKSAAASINLDGSSVVVTPNSSVEFKQAGVDVVHGGARVSTSSGMSAIAGQYVVSPKDATAKFDVLNAGDKVVVVSRQGALTIKDGSRTIPVASGATTELAMAEGAKAVPLDAPVANFLGSERLVEHPFYGSTTGTDSKPSRLKVCEATILCIRPSVSKIPPCCCPPIIACD
jgi:hypothetical protein